MTGNPVIAPIWRDSADFPAPPDPTTATRCMLPSPQTTAFQVRSTGASPEELVPAGELGPAAGGRRTFAVDRPPSGELSGKLGHSGGGGFALDATEVLLGELR